jgi:hypothetical protein
MASPISGGTKHGIAISSRDVTVLHEWIVVKPDRDFTTAAFDVTYEIESAVEGQQIPLLFIARNYIGDFHLNVDGMPVSLLSVPDSILHTDHTLLAAFRGATDTSDADHDPHVSVTYDGHSYEQVRLSELKYFLVDLPKGVHRINLTYNAEPELDRSDWIRQYRLAYSLSPARHWKSFGPLDLTIDARNQSDKLLTNLRVPDSGSLNGVAVWHFKELPANFFQICYTPRATTSAQTLLAIKPEGLAVILAVALFVVHLWTVIRYRKRGGVRKVSPPVLIGSLLLPFLFLVGWIWFYSLIDMAIGKDASRRHGYQFLLLGFYVVIMPLYLLAMLLIDYWLKRHYAVKAD